MRGRPFFRELPGKGQPPASRRPACPVRRPESGAITQPDGMTGPPASGYGKIMEECPGVPASVSVPFRD
ncbi:hypothetical protein HMPREF3038_00463 [Akkermansia sp. KLE1797]|nr:hypothetical protein HMPREF3038_00463 [Akkermansia sp. KLE1797]KXU55620.1 hypothetical protein HMPREF3039_00177 [Akkermansia sp. KLE1798]